MEMKSRYVFWIANRVESKITYRISSRDFGSDVSDSEEHCARLFPCTCRLSACLWESSGVAY